MSNLRFILDSKAWGKSFWRLPLYVSLLALSACTLDWISDTASLSVVITVHAPKAMNATKTAKMTGMRFYNTQAAPICGDGVVSGDEVCVMMGRSMQMATTQKVDCFATRHDGFRPYCVMVFRILALKNVTPVMRTTMIKAQRSSQ